ncbi:hypothetical protein PVAP13_6NG185000 [Panicum virgatum]|uniref:Uncharacterized protein n=1 Tax=Panicum virgatum TaxID=38727 RepID=A0A8T0QYT4_PANVG|nr:hypothetical protein PVAP13_6NG185000 [Panicum virgatum]
METESASSASIRQRGRVKPPLITCPDCRCRRVVELKSKKPWSKCHVFYTCPNHKSDGTRAHFGTGKTVVCST